MNKILFNRLTSLKNSYLVFIVALLAFIVGLGLYLVLDANATAPTVTYSRESTVVTVTSTFQSSSSYKNKFLNDGSNDYWKYATVSSSSNCNSNSFSGTVEKATLDTTESSADRKIAVLSIREVDTTNDNYYCIQVLYGLANNNSSLVAHYDLFILDNTNPVTVLSQAGTKLKASVTDSSSVQNWSVGSSEPDVTSCTNSLNYAQKVDSDTDFSINQKNATLTLSSSDHGKFYCFKITDSQGNIGYSAPLKIDLVAPLLVSHQANAVLTVTISNDSRGHAAIDSTSWQYKVVNSSVCDNTLSSWRQLSSLSKATISSNKATLALNSSDNNRRYCFRVADNASNYAYSWIRIAPINNPPTISSLRQNKQKVIGYASDATYVDNTSWRYAIVTSSTCDSTVSSTWYSTGLTTSNNRTNASTVNIDLGSVSIDESLNNQWLCLRVADSLATNYGYRSLDVDTTSPVVTVVQNNAVLRATTGANDGAVASTWNYVSNDSIFTCNEQAFSLYTPVRRNNVVSLGQQNVGDHYCFRVADRHDNYGYSDVYRVNSLDTTAPVISASQTNDILTVTATNLSQIQAGTWGYVNTTETANRVVCSDTDSRTYINVPTTLKIQLVESDSGSWFCIRAADLQDNYGYFAIKIRTLDATPPTISIAQNNDLLTASSTSADVDNDTWQYAVLTSSHSLICAESNRANLNFNSASANNQKVRLQENDHLRYYCFRVADKLGNDAYALSAQITPVDSAPVLVATQSSSESRIQVSTDAPDVNGLTWGWAVFTYDPSDCSTATGYASVAHSAMTSRTATITIRDIADSQAGSYYCFRVADTSNAQNPNYGYVKHRYDLGAPTIYFSYNQRTKVLTAFSRDKDIDASTWRYASFNAQPADCSKETVNHTLPKNNKLNLTSTDSNVWLCFKVADNVGNYGYALYSVSTISDSTAPIIDVAQTVYVATATSAANDLDTATWRYALAVNEPNCATTDYAATTATGKGQTVDITQSNSTYNWVCFAVDNVAAQTGYAKHPIDRTAPTINITQNNIVLELSSPDADVDNNTWGYVKSETDINCDNSISFAKLDVNNGKVSFDLLPADSGWYFCFRVADNVGRFDYKKVQIDSLDLSAPVISLVQTNTVLTASASNVDSSSWQYLRSSQDVNCSASNTALNFNTAHADNKQVRLQTRDNGHWFCFKVVGDNNVAGYAKILVNNVDGRQPIIQVVQDDDSVMATADETIKTWQYVVVEDSADCRKAAFANTSVVTAGNELDITPADHQVIYCFRAIDTAGNASYKAITVSAAAEETPQPGAEDEEEDQKDEVDPAAETDNENRLLLIIGGVVVGLLVIVIVTLVIISSRRQTMDGDGEGYDDDYTQYQ